jgi:hypothetical protein
METQDWSRQIPPAAREMLEAGLRVKAPAAARRAVWNELAAKLPVAAVTGVAAGATTVTLVRLFGLGLALGVATAVTIPAFRHFTHEAGAPTPSAVPAPFAAADTPSIRYERATARVDSPPAPAPATAVRGSALPSESSAAAEPPPEVATGPSVAAFPADTPRAVPENAVLYESRRVAHVRSLLRAGQFSSALGELAELDRGVPRGVLVQEREALRIEVLLGLGERARAREEAQRFLARYPGSPHTQGVERALR